MSRAQELRIEQQQSVIAGLREQVSELRAEARGEGRGRDLVAAQLAHDIRLGTLREEQHRARAAQCYGDLQRALQIVAAHALDVRDRAPDVVALLEDAFVGAGISLRQASIAVQVERADAAARVSAAQAATAVVSAPYPAPPSA